MRVHASPSSNQKCASLVPLSFPPALQNPRVPLDVVGVYVGESILVQVPLRLPSHPSPMVGALPHHRDLNLKRVENFEIGKMRLE